MKYLKHLFTALLLMCVAVASAQQTFTVDGIRYQQVTSASKSVSVVKNDYSDYRGNVVIPPTVNFNNIIFNVVSIEYDAFAGCTGLTSIEIPNSVTSIRNGAFQGCIGLTSVEIPNSVTELYSSVFSGCTGLTNIEIPNSVTSISSYAFYGCTGLTKIEIPTNLTRIEGYAFKECSGLTSLTIPSRVAAIGDNAFKGCVNIENVICHATIAPELGVNVFDDISKDAVLTYPEESNYLTWKRFFANFDSEKYGSAEWFKDNDGGAYVYTTSNTSVFSHEVLSSFPDYQSLKRIYIDGFTSIGNDCFAESSIEEVYIMSNVRSIGDRAFYNCSELNFINLGPVNTIGFEAFYNCRNLEYVDFYGVEKVKGSAFASTGIEFAKFWDVELGRNAFSCYKKDANGDNLPVLIVIMVPGSGLYSSEINVGVDKMFLLLSESTDDIGKEDFEFSFGPNIIGYYDRGHQDYYLWNDKLFIFGQVGRNQELEQTGQYRSVVYIPDIVVERSFYIFTETNKPVEVLKGGASEVEDRIYTIPGSNAIFRVGGELIAGSANSIIPEGTKSITEGAFANCQGLRSVDIPSSVIAIDAGAFTNCIDLASIQVDENNGVYDSREGCNAIIETASNKLVLGSKNTVIPASVTSIGCNAFSVSPNADIVIPANVTSIDVSAFSGANNLYFESEIPAEIAGDIFGSGMVFVPDNAYDAYCNANVWSDYKDKITTRAVSERIIESFSTEGTSGVFNAIGLNNIEKVVKLKVKGRINSYDIILFRDKMPLLNDLDLSEAVVVASSRPYYQSYCTRDNSFDGYAFYELDQLVSVKLPKTLEALGEYAFARCDNLTSVDASYADNLDISSYAFYDCRKLVEFFPPDNISNVGRCAFAGCENLTELHLRNVVGSIGTGAFEGGLLSIKIDSIGGDIKSSAFGKKIKEVRIGAIAGNIDSRAFDYCYELRHVEIGKGPARIGSGAFYNASDLESFVAGDGLIEIADNAFSEYRNFFLIDRVEVRIVERKNLKKVVLPQSVQKIGKEAFANCISLHDFSIPQGVTDIGESAFENCSSIESIDIPSGITEIPVNAFYKCISLKDVSFQDGLVTIGSRSFENTAINQLNLPLTLKTIDSRAFSDCDSLKELRIPSSVENIGDAAFGGCNNLYSIYTYTIEPTTITESTFSTFASAALYVPATSFQNYYWNIGWSKFNYRNFKEFNESYEYFYLNGDYCLNSGTGYIEGTPDANLYPGSGLIVSGDENNEDIKQNLGDVSLESDGEGNSASIIGDNSLYIENLNVKINIKGGRWYFFAFPWDVELDRISMQNGSDYVFRYYDGDERAKNGNGGWKNVNESHLKAARGYIFQSSGDDVLVISIEDVKFKKEDKYNELITHASENLNDASWNLMGNPYLSYYDLADMEYTAPVTVWDGEKYVAMRPGDDDYQFTPYEAFFVQKPEGEESVTFAADGQMTKTQAETAMQQKAAARRVRGIDPQRLLVNLVLGNDVTEDRTRVVFNERQTHNYETACDAAKFMTAGVPQIYTIDDEGVHYAINERPKGNGVVLMGYTAPVPGYYTIDAPRMDTQVFLYDADTGEIHYFEDGAYRFSSEAGTYEKRFSLGIRDDEATGIEEVKGENGEVNGENGKVKTIYDLHGRKLNRADRGVYIINGEKVVK